YSASLPSSECGTQVQFYLTADSNSGDAETLPGTAPVATFSVVSAFAVPVVAFNDNFESNQGWSVSGDSASAASGRWERATPTGAGIRADAPSDFDGSGQCFITGNGLPGDNTDVDVDQTILTSPVMDATGKAIISYARWFNNAGNPDVDDRFFVEISDNAGSTWTALETLGINHPESNGGWFTVSLNLEGIAGFTPNSQFQIRFIAEDIGEGSIVEAGIDAVQLQVVNCEECLADITGEGILNLQDVFAFLALFNAQDPSADLATPFGVFNLQDVFAYLALFNQGCP
ncbi:MAG: hypothetical protein JKY96_09055, partial [Phycisphaerales bacterium]|nr:hypothetical protein [Phycisphaerales bacterium]